MDNPGDKPEAHRIGWRLLRTRYLFEDPWLRLREDRIAVGSRKMTFTYQEQPGGVVVVPLTGDGRIVLVRQYRYPIDAWSLEVPAGGLHDTGGADLADVARKELHEETGASCETIHAVGSFFSSAALSNEVCHVFLATGVTMDRFPRTEETEHIEILPMPAETVLEMARTGEIKTGPSALALFLCEPLLRQELAKNSPLSRSAGKGS